MILTIDRTDLIAGLAPLQGIATKRSSIPLLACVLLRADSDAGAHPLTLRATDTLRDLTVPLSARVEAAGEVAVDATGLFQVIRALPEAVVHLKADERHLHIRSGKASFSLVISKAADFPPPVPLEAKGSLSLAGADLLRLIGEVGFAVCEDDNRYGINGVHIERLGGDGSPDRLRFVATDGSRLAWSEAPATGDGTPPRRTLLPRAVLGDLKKIVREDSSVSLTFGERSARVAVGGTCLDVRLVDGEFPDYRRVLPQSSKRSATLGRAPLTDALKRVSIVASDRNRSIRFAFAGESLTLSARNVDLGEVREEMPADLTGEPMATGFNGSYFQDILGATRGESLSLGMGDTLDPCVVTLPGRADCAFIVMPMRLD